ncbi:MAG: hypothetical protein AAB334_00460 [Patescibacteria group bacterium]
MGFFSKYNEIEKGLLETYSKLFADINLPDSRKMAGDILDQCIENSKKEGHYNLKDVGDTLLEKEKSSGQVNPNFESKRTEGVKNEDIRWWFNLNDVERRMMLKIDEFHRMSLFIHEVESGKTEEEADKTVRKYHPIFGDLKDETHGSGDNRPLPLELKDRINIYIEKQGVGNPEFKKKIDSSSTFNALIRNEIRAGNI